MIIKMSVLVKMSVLYTQIFSIITIGLSDEYRL